MKKILLLDTSVASNNKGDDIIMECTQKELAPILKDNFVRTLPTHVSPFHWYQIWRNSNAVKSFAKCDLKFVGGSNILVPNLLTHFPQWNINIFNYQPMKGCILVGVGAGAGAENGSNWYTQYIYKNMLNREYLHSARDERSKVYIQSLGLKAINTGCVTMWMMTPELCKLIPSQKAERVVFTFTARTEKDNRDQFIIDTLLKNYKEIYFWPQCLGDFEYFKSFENISRIHILQATKEAYDEYLTNNDTDYVGTRLHGGIYAMRHKRRAIIIAIDERATAIHEKNHLNCLAKDDIQDLSSFINRDFKTEIRMDLEAIYTWKKQFKNYKIK